MVVMFETESGIVIICSDNWCENILSKHDISFITMWEFSRFDAYSLTSAVSMKLYDRGNQHRPFWAIPR